MEGLTLEDVIAGRAGTLTEDDVVAFVHNADPNERDWDDFPLRMTYRIHAYLRAHGPIEEPDLALLEFF